MRVRRSRPPRDGDDRDLHARIVAISEEIQDAASSWRPPSVTGAGTPGGAHLLVHAASMPRRLRAGARALRGIASEAEDELTQAARRRVGDHGRSTGAPLKHELREIEDPVERRLMLRALSAIRDETVTRCIRERTVRWDRPLTRADAVGERLDERVVELPLAVELVNAAAPDVVLDAGAALNLAPLRGELDPRGRLIHVTQSAEREQPLMDRDRFSYLFADLRDLPLRDGSVAHVLCISTLEHVGMDNSRYGAPAEHAPDSSLDVVDELRRVVRPGGTIMVSVPFGRAADHGWYRTFGADDVARVLERFAGDDIAIRYLAYRGSWVDADPDTVPAEDPGEERVLGLCVIRARRAPS